MNTFAINHDDASDIAHSALWIPTELLMAIIDLVESEDDLLALAATSRQFHNLALDRYFGRHNFDPSSKDVVITFFDNSVKALKGLAISLDLVGSSIDRLSYDSGYTHDSAQLMKELRLLTHYTSNLASVACVKLRLATHFSGAGDSKGWRDMNILLLNTILARSCRDIHITTRQISFSRGEPKNMPSSSKPIDWLKGYWPINHPPPSDAPKGLRSCYIESFPPFLRPFYFHTLSTNTGSITGLTFKNIFGGGADWASMLASLHFPSLHQLTIIYGVIPRDPLVKFLQRHPRALTAFEYHHIRYDPRPKLPMRSKLLEPVFQACLETLTVSPEHIINFMPSFAVISHLRDVEIRIEEHTSDTGDGSFASLERALRVLAPCTNRITLSLSIMRTGLGLGAWFTQMFAPRGNFKAEARPERKLHCVETLVIDNGDWGLTDSTISTYLPRWLVLFPQLMVLTLRGDLSVRQPHKSSLMGAFVAGLKEACPDIHIEDCTN